MIEINKACVDSSACGSDVIFFHAANFGNQYENLCHRGLNTCSIHGFDLSIDIVFICINPSANLIEFLKRKPWHTSR